MWIVVALFLGSWVTAVFIQLEVRSHEVPFLLEDGQVVGRLVFERLLSAPQKVYGQGIGSSYQRQRLALSKHLRR